MSRLLPIEYYENLHNKIYPNNLIKVLYMEGPYVYFETDFGLCKKLKSCFGKTGYKLESAVNKTDFFIRKASKIHNYKYLYTNTEFINSKSKIKIICPIHGEFEQKANHHISGHGCQKCATISAHKKNNSVISNWTLKNWEENGKNSKSFSGFKCYILKCWNDKEEFYKIGRTFQTINRRFHDKNLMPYNYEILKVYEDSPKIIYTLEILLKRKNKYNKYVPSINFGGKEECYTRIDNL